MNRALAKAGVTSLDAKARLGRSDTSCVAAIHGGSTRSYGILASETGRIYEIRPETEGMNWRETAEEKVVTALGRFYAHFAHTAGTDATAGHACKRLALAAAGLFCDFDKAQIGAFVSMSGWANTELILTHDARATLLAGAMQDQGVVIMAGSSAVIYARTRSGNQCLVGGGGSLIGNEGGGFYIAREALNAVLRSRDGRMRQKCDALEYCILSHLGYSDTDGILNWLNVLRHKGTLLQLATITPAVIQAAQNYQDPIAQAILHDAARELLVCFGAVRNKLAWEDEEIPVIIEGGVIEHCSIISEMLMNEVPKHEPRASVSFPQYRTVLGALFLALSHGDSLPGKEILQELEDSMRSFPKEEIALLVGPGKRDGTGG